MHVAKDALRPLVNRFPSQLVGGRTGDAAEFRLFHAAASICSQKVRAVLVHAARPFLAHNINIFAGENYDPNYVKLRAEACVDAGHDFAAHHSGSTSVAATGCDPCVVPTLVDNTTDNVTINSLQICVYLSERVAPALRPTELSDEIASEIATVDGLPNYPLLASKVYKRSEGAHGNAFALGKVERCNKLIAEHASDHLLVEAYTAKREKESSANTELFTPEAIKAAEDHMRGAFTALEGRLSDQRTFLYSHDLTLADIFWATEFIRADDLGYTGWIEGAPKLARYYSNLKATNSIRNAILEWPGARIKLPT